MDTEIKKANQAANLFVRKRMYCKERVLKIFFLLMLMFFGTICHAQSDKDKEIPLEKSKDLFTDNKPKRDLELLSVLPTMYYYSETEEIGIVSNFITFEDVIYEICNEQGATLLSDIISLPKNEEVYVSTATLPSGKYYIYIIIDEQRFVGELNK